jgi:hypothetical protein
MKNFILFIALLLGASLHAQESISIRDAVLGLRDKYRPDNLRNLQWIKGMDAFSQTEKTDSGWIITLTEVPSFKKNLVTTLKKINEAGKFTGKEALASIPPITWINADAFEFSKGLQRYQFTRINNNLQLGFGYRCQYFCGFREFGQCSSNGKSIGYLLCRWGWRWLRECSYFGC